jgi:hypothetical protein
LTLGADLFFSQAIACNIIGFKAEPSIAFPCPGQRYYEISLNLFPEMCPHDRWSIGLQNGSLHRYLLVTIGVFTLTTTAVWWRNARRLGHPSCAQRTCRCPTGCWSPSWPCRCGGGPHPIPHPGGIRPGYVGGGAALVSFGLWCPGSGTHPVAGGNADPDHRLHRPAAPAADWRTIGNGIRQPMRWTVWWPSAREP